MSSWMSVLTVYVPVLLVWGSCVETLMSVRFSVSVGAGERLQGLVFSVTIPSLQH